MANFDNHASLLGHLMIRFGYLELTIKSVLANVMNLTNHELNSLIEFGQLKVSAMPALMLSLLRDAPLTDKDQHETLIKSLQEITQVTVERNQFVHWLWIGGDVPSISNMKGSTKRKFGSDRLVDAQQLEQVLRRTIDLNNELCHFLKGSDPFYVNRIDVPISPMPIGEVPETMRHHSSLIKMS